MGSEERADNMSGKFKDNTLKAIAGYTFKNCGNCVSRVKCAEKILSSGGKSQPFVFIQTELIDNCPKENFNHVGVVANEVTSFFQSTCGKCDKLKLCAGYLSEAGGRMSAEDKAKVHEKLLKCANCDRMNQCIQHMMNKLNIGKFRLMSQALLILFKKCSTEEMQKVYIDMDDDTNVRIEGNVHAK